MDAAPCKKRAVKFDFNSGGVTTRKYVSIFYLKKNKSQAINIIFKNTFYLDRKIYFSWFEIINSYCFCTFRLDI